MYRGKNVFKRSYQPRSKLLEDENGDLLAESCIILNRRKKYCSQLLNIHNVSDVRHIYVYIHTAGPLCLEVGIAIVKL
jgi:hypothetical protein